MKLLIVDDSFIMRKSIEKCVAGLGLTGILTAPNGKEALEIFMRERPELVTLDITMPEMDGLACLDAMMKVNGSARIIVVSALKDSATGLDAIKKGAKGFLPKPFTPDQLREELTVVIGG